LILVFLEVVNLSGLLNDFDARIDVALLDLLLLSQLFKLLLLLKNQVLGLFILILGKLEIFSDLQKFIKKLIVLFTLSVIFEPEAFVGLLLILLLFNDLLNLWILVPL
jgi:hypothetical protein